MPCGHCGSIQHTLKKCPHEKDSIIVINHQLKMQEKRRAKQREYIRKRREQETPEQKLKRKERDKINKRERRAMKSKQQQENCYKDKVCHSIARIHQERKKQQIVDNEAQSNRKSKQIDTSKVHIQSTDSPTDSNTLRLHESDCIIATNFPWDQLE